MDRSVNTSHLARLLQGNRTRPTRGLVQILNAPSRVIKLIVRSHDSLRKQPVVVVCPKSSQRYLKFFLRLIMGDRSDDVEDHTRTRERMAHGNVYALVRRPDRVCVSLFRPYRDQRLSVYAVAS